jgi:hypothetical protein
MKEELNSTAGEHSGASLCSELFCECVNWCRVDPLGEMGNGHHPRCKQYVTAPPDPRHAVFGKLMWQMIEKLGGDFCGDEWSEEVLPLAERAGLCSRVIYDPEKHGDGIDAEPGDEIWWWGDSFPNDPSAGTGATGPRLTGQ